MANTVMSLFYVVPTQTGRHYSSDALRLDRKKSCQNSGRIVSGSLTFLRQEAVIPRPNFSHPVSVWMMDCSWANR